MRRKSLLTTRTKQNSLEIGEQTFPSPSPSEQASILEIFPEYENTIQFYAFGKINSQGKQYENGICAISMHYIGFFSQKSSGLAKKVAFFNVLSLKKFILSHANKHQQLILETEATNATLLSGPVLMVARIIYRNYSFSTFTLPQDKKTIFCSYDASLFPPIQFPLSISQIFQFRFAALSSQNELKYDHSITQYLHSLMQSHNPIFNFKHLPNSFLPQQLFPLFQSLINIPIIGISCSNCNAPTIFSAIIPLIEKSQSIRIVKLTNCNANDGLTDFCHALDSNAELPLEQLFINENDFSDLSPLLQSISTIKSNLTHFSISGCRITSSIFKQFCKLLLSSRSLSSLVHLGIGGAELGEDSIVDFREYLKMNHNLISLDISGSSHFSSLLAALSNALSSFSSSVRALNVSGCDFDDSSFAQLNNVSPFITELDISSTNLNYYEISDVISLLGKSIQPSSSTSLFLTIKLNRLNLEKEKSLLIIRGFLNNDLKKWRRIELDDTHISADELCAYQALFLHMPNLQFLSMGGNFGEDEAQLASSLTEISSLRTLKLSNSKLASIIPQVIATTTLKEVDFSYGNLTENDAILLLTCENLEKVKLDGIEFNNVDSIIEKVTPKCNLKHVPFKGAMLPLKPKKKKATNTKSDENIKTGYELFEETLLNSNVYQHSCVCEDLQMLYPFGDQPYEKQCVQIGDPNIYNTFHINMIALEKNSTITKLKKVLEYPKVQQSNDESESEYSSDLSIDELVHSNLISSLSDTMFTGLGGTLSDSSLDSSDHRRRKKNRLSKLSASSQHQNEEEKAKEDDKTKNIDDNIKEPISDDDDEIDAALVFAVSKSQDSLMHISYADAVKSDNEENDDEKEKEKKRKKISNNDVGSPDLNRKKKKNLTISPSNRRKNSAANDKEEEEAASENESSYSNSENKRANYDDDSDGNNDSSSGRTHHHGHRRRKHKDTQDQTQRKVKKSRSLNSASQSPTSNKPKNYDEEIDDDNDNEINLNVDAEVDNLNFDEDENKVKNKTNHHQYKQKRNKQNPYDIYSEEEENETKRKHKQRHKHKQIAKSEFDENENDAANNDKIENNLNDENEFNLEDNENKAKKVKHGSRLQQDKLTLNIKHNDIDLDVDNEIDNDNDSGVSLIFSSQSTVKKLFGSIAEESSAALQQQQPIMRKIPPPPPSPNDKEQPGEFSRFSSSTSGTASPSLKKKGSGNQQNPIILAFSPPTEP